MHEDKKSIGEFIEHRLKPGDPISVYAGTALVGAGYYISSEDDYLVWINTTIGAAQVTHLGDSTSVTIS